ncbi:MAG: hypothetical protein AB4352_10285 [Hormoscilla sp.]
MEQLYLPSLLAKWATLEPDRCRLRPPATFEVIYQGDWYSVADYPGSHGMLFAAILDSCEHNGIYCAIAYHPGDLQQRSRLEVSCFPKSCRWRSGDHLTAKLPALFLGEYLAQLEWQQQQQTD